MPSSLRQPWELLVQTTIRKNEFGSQGDELVVNKDKKISQSLSEKNFLLCGAAKRMAVDKKRNDFRLDRQNDRTFADMLLPCFMS